MINRDMVVNFDIIIVKPPLMSWYGLQLENDQTSALDTRAGIKYVEKCIIEEWQTSLRAVRLARRG